MFSTLYQTVLRWSSHPKAERYLAMLSFAESSFFPIPPDVMLAPMCLANVKRAIWLATLTTITSVLGGMFGYVIGLFFLDLVEPIITQLHYQDKIKTVNQWFEQWGFWAVLIAGFSPVPYKLFTITAGAAGMAFFPFVLASFVGRGARFYLVAILIKWGGDRFKHSLERYIETIGWVVTTLILVGLIFYNVL